MRLRSVALRVIDAFGEVGAASMRAGVGHEMSLPAWSSVRIAGLPEVERGLQRSNGVVPSQPMPKGH
jgi:hypothetical protein